MDVVRLYKRAEELEESTAEARYRTLQNQLNPHFLFNSLNTLVSEIEYNPVNAIEFTRNLADTYRYILYCQDKHTVELNEELQFLDTYVLLQKVRLGDCLQVDNRIADKFGETPVPPLSLQLLVENVIKHNVISMKKPMTVNVDGTAGRRCMDLCGQCRTSEAGRSDFRKGTGKPFPAVSPALWKRNRD